MIGPRKLAWHRTSFRNPNPKKDHGAELAYEVQLWIGNEFHHFKIVPYWLDNKTRDWAIYLNGEFWEARMKLPMAKRAVEYLVRDKEAGYFS